MGEIKSLIVCLLRPLKIDLFKAPLMHCQRMCSLVDKRMSALTIMALADNNLACLVIVSVLEDIEILMFNMPLIKIFHFNGNKQIHL